MKTIAIAISLAVLFAITSENDYADAKLIEAQRAELRALRAPKAEVQPPVWSQTCERRGQTFVASQSDGGKWVVKCTGPRRT